MGQKQRSAFIMRSNFDAIHFLVLNVRQSMMTLTNRVFNTRGTLATRVKGNMKKRLRWNGEEGQVGRKRDIDRSCVDLASATGITYMCRFQL